MLQSLIDELGSLASRIKRGKAVNLNDRDTKEVVIALATRYFEDVRPQLVGALGETQAIGSHDQRWQDLVRLAHGNNQRSSYTRLLSTLSKDLTSLSVEMLTRVAGATPGARASDLTPAEERLVATLQELLPTAADSYRQGLLDLGGGPRLSYRGTASEFREALRETLDYLAPDEDVVAQPGFQFEKNQTRPTMKQKVRFVMKSRGRNTSQRAATERSVVGLEDLVADVLRATYGRASVATHVETTRAEVLRIKRYIDTVLFDLLEISE